VDEECGKLNELWGKALGTINWSNEIYQLRTCLSCRQHRNIQSIPRTVDITPFTRVYKGTTIEILESIK